jgi:hypothetical protein
MKTPRKRCPNGTRKNRKTGICEVVIKVKKNSIEQIELRKRCPNGSRKNRQTGLCEPKDMDFYYLKSLKRRIARNSKLSKRTPAFAKKMAAKKIAKFMIQPQVQEKRRGAFLKSICSDSNVCVAFGIEDKKIQDYFNGFTDFQYAVAPIKRIGEVSVNGFVNEIMYERNNYIAYSVLKSSVKKDADNLMYEYIVGKYLNKMSMYYPCFLKTYGIYQYTNVDYYNNMKLNKTVDNTNVLRRLNQLEISDPPTISELLKGCYLSKYLCVLTQHVKNAIPIKDVHGIDIYFLLYQVYFTLHCMRNNYTHYDLHVGNVLCYKPASNAYVEFHYHLNNGQVIDFVSTYLVYIIDYGRSYFYENANNNSVVVHKKICEATCPSVCGEEEGFGILHGTLKKDYAIDSHVNNCSADLRLLTILQQQRNILSEKIVFTKVYGTPQKKDSGLNATPRAIHNVTDALQVITEKVLQYKNEMKGTMNFVKYTKLGTMHVYENGTTPVFFEKA